MSLCNPTVAEITTFLQTFFPTRPGDLPFVYHRPFASSFSPWTFTVASIVLSVTATPGFYSSLDTGTKLGFLHRPFDLDRKCVPPFGTILSSHKGFDEVLTVGYNVALASKLGLDVQQGVVIQGYKGDPERRIGLVARFANGAMHAEAARQLIWREFGDKVDGAFGFENSRQREAPTQHWIDGIAIMNAFHPEEVERVALIASTLGFAQHEDRLPSLIYLTGAIREAGLEVAQQKGMKVICVGHRCCEDWGIRYLAQQLGQQFPRLKVEEIYEEEPPKMVVAKKGSLRVSSPEEVIASVPPKT